MQFEIADYRCGWRLAARRRPPSDRLLERRTLTCVLSSIGLPIGGGEASQVFDLRLAGFRALALQPVRFELKS